MTVEHFRSPARLLERAEFFFARNPVTTNVISSVAKRLSLHGDDVAGGNTHWFLLTDPDHTIVGAAMANEPWNLFISPMSDLATLELIENLDALDVTLPGVTGERRSAGAFARRWATRHDLEVRTLVNERAHRLELLTPPIGISGWPRLARSSDAPLLERAEFFFARNPVTTNVISSVAKRLSLHGDDVAGGNVTHRARLHATRFPDPRLCRRADGRRGTARAGRRRFNRHALHGPVQSHIECALRPHRFRPRPRRGPDRFRQPFLGSSE